MNYLWKAEMRVRRGHLGVGGGVHAQHQARELEHGHTQTVALHTHMHMPHAVSHHRCCKEQATHGAQVEALGTWRRAARREAKVR